MKSDLRNGLPYSENKDNKNEKYQQQNNADNFLKSEKSALGTCQKKSNFTKNISIINDGKDEFRKRSQIKSTTINTRQT